MNPLLEKLIADEPALEAAVPQIMAAFELWKDSFAQGGKTLVCGNGGSAADSEHIVGELMKGFLLKRPLPWEEKDRLQEAFGSQGTYLAAHLQGALPAISLASQTSLLTAFANDVAADLIFAQRCTATAVQEMYYWPSVLPAAPPTWFMLCGWQS